MDKFLAGIVAGLLIERFQLINVKTDALSDAGLIKSENWAADILPIAIMVGFIVLLIWVFCTLNKEEDRERDDRHYHG